MLYKCASPKENLRQDIIPIYEKVRHSFPDDVRAPNNIEEFFSDIKKNRRDFDA